MSFTRVKPGNWAIGEQLTSAQMNTLDTDHANALDKSAAGDTLLGVVVIPGGVSGRLSLTGAGAVAATVSAALGATGAGAIGSSVAGGIVSGVQGGIQLTGGANDWPTFSANRTRTVPCLTSHVPALVSGWSINGAALQGPGNATNPQQILLGKLHSGATIATVSMNFFVGTSHSSVPATLPSLGLRSIATGTGVDSLVASGSPATPGSGAAWFNGGAAQSWTFNVNVAVNDANLYYLLLFDEGGAGALSGNVYFAAQIAFSGIADMRFP